MIRKITLENFMSHGKTVVELADGLTVLTGPNNCGKSALVSALQILAANGRTTHVIRHGSKVCRVTVETDDDQTIVWERNKSTVKYSINGEDVHRIGQGVPERLHESLRLDKVAADSGTTKNEYEIHFGEQKSPVFLLNESGSRAAAFFASSSDAARLVEMQHLHRTRTARARSEAKRLSSESEQNVARLAAFAAIDAISASIKAAEELQAQIAAQQQQIRVLTTVIGHLRTFAGHVTRWRDETGILEKLDIAKTTPDELRARGTECERLRVWLDTAANWTRIRDIERSRVHSLSRLQPLPAQHPAAALRMLIHRIEETQRRHRVANHISRSCRPLAAPPRMQPAEACRQISRKLATAIENEAVAKLACEALAGLTIPPPAHDTRGIWKLIKQLSTAADSRAAMKARLCATDELAPPPTIVPTQPLRQVLASLAKEQDRRDRIACRVRSLVTLRAIEPPNDPKPVKTILEQLKQLATSVEESHAAAVKADALVKNHERLIREFVSENPKCATCGGSIDPETLMSSMPGMHEHATGGPPPEPIQ